MKNILAGILLVLLSIQMIAQEETDIIHSRPKNNFSIGLLGEGLFTLNYERVDVLGPNFLLAGKAGLGYAEDFTIFSPKKQFMTFSHQVTANLGREWTFMEMGIGGMLISGDGRSSYYVYPVAGFRFLPPRPHHVSFRVFIQVPIPLMGPDDALILPFGVNVGWCF